MENSVRAMSSARSSITNGSCGSEDASEGTYLSIDCKNLDEGTKGYVPIFAFQSLWHIAHMFVDQRAKIESRAVSLSYLIF